MRKYKIGDRIIVNGLHGNKSFSESVCRVVALDDGWDSMICVEIEDTSTVKEAWEDCRQPRLHDCDGAGASGKCWWMFVDDGVKFYQGAEHEKD